MTLSGFEAALKTAVEKVFHHEAEKAQPPYLVYSEYRRAHMHADNAPYAAELRVQVDYYTRDKDDAAPMAIGAALAAAGVACGHDILYEPALKLVRHMYDCRFVER